MVTTGKQVQIGNLALQVLAFQSEGLVLNSSNDGAGEIATCAADANAFYVLSFDGLAGDGPNEYHGLEIKIAEPGLEARTRSGYYTQPEQAGISIQTPRQRSLRHSHLGHRTCRSTLLYFHPSQRRMWPRPEGSSWLTGRGSDTFFSARFKV